MKSTSPNFYKNIGLILFTACFLFTAGFSISVYADADKDESGKKWEEKKREQEKKWEEKKREQEKKWEEKKREQEKKWEEKKREQEKRYEEKKREQEKRREEKKREQEWQREREKEGYEKQKDDDTDQYGAPDDDTEPDYPDPPETTTPDDTQTPSNCGTSIRTILRNADRYMNQTVTICGTVSEILGVKYTNVGAFKVYDGTDAMWVVPGGVMPSKGDSVIITGKVESGVSVSNINLGVIIRENGKNVL
jgi:hypothetical protein